MGFHLPLRCAGVSGAQAREQPAPRADDHSVGGRAGSVHQIADGSGPAAWLPSRMGTGDFAQQPVGLGVTAALCLSLASSPR
jgi:hypothetical protein